MLNLLSGLPHGNQAIDCQSIIFNPAFGYVGKSGIKTIFIESWTRVIQPTVTGRIVYPVSDVFLVQWGSLLSKYGKKAKYEGGIA